MTKICIKYIKCEPRKSPPQFRGDARILAIVAILLLLLYYAKRETAR